MQSHPSQTLNWTPVNAGAVESFWVLAQRFMVRNVLSPYEFCYRFRREQFRTDSEAGTHIYQRMDLRRLAHLLGHTQASIPFTLPMAWEVGLRSDSLSPLRLCLECAEQGYHTALFETGWLDVCPIHNRELTRHCPTCRRRLGHVSWKRFGPAPGTLACGHAWSGVSIRHATSIDAMSVRQLAAWVGRLRARSSGEAWYAISLQGTSSLEQDDPDFRELVDHIAAMVELGGDIEAHLSFWIRHFKRGRIRRTVSTEVRADWFDATLYRVSRYMGGLTTMPWIDQKGFIHRTYEAHLNLRHFGPERLVGVIKRRLCLLPLWHNATVRHDLGERELSAIACALVHKHVTSSTYPQFVADTPRDYIEFMCRYSGAPMGLLRIRRRETAVYWMPMKMTPSRLAQRSQEKRTE